MIHLKAEDFKSEILDFKGTAIVDFYTDWCGPCKVLSPILESLSDKYDSIKICKLNIENAQELAKVYNINSVPFIAAFRNGKLIESKIGFSGIPDIDSFVQKHAK